MNVLIACEESQRVCMAFRERGHDAFSCDIQEPSGGHPEWHILGDALQILNPTTEGIVFKTMDGKAHHILKWDLLIAHPPCTYLTVTGERWFDIERYGDKARQRHKDRQSAAEFFMKFAKADCNRIAIENPIGYMSSYYREPNQIIQPFWFGDKAKKATCLWLKNLPCLRHTNIVKPEIREYKRANGKKARFSVDYCIGGKDRAKNRSKTYIGIAEAMAEQWGCMPEYEVQLTLTGE